MASNHISVDSKNITTPHARAFLALYDQHGDAIYRFILFKVSDTEAASDLAQECFMKAWEYWQRPEKKVDNERAFLFAVARNLVIDHWRSRGRAQVISIEREEIDVVDVKSNTIHDSAVLRDEAEHILALIQRLPPDDREVLTLRFTEDLPFQDIAHITGKSVIAVRVQAHRALKKLKILASRQ